MPVNVGSVKVGYVSSRLIYPIIITPPKGLYEIFGTKLLKKNELA